MSLYNVQVIVQVYSDAPTIKKEFSIISVEANDEQQLSQNVATAVAHFYEDEGIGFADVDSKGNLQGKVKEFFENQVKWHPTKID